MQKLKRNADDKVFAGVAGGVAQHLDVDPKLVRLGWVVLAWFTIGLAAFAYVYLWVTTPVDDGRAADRDSS